MNTAPRRSGVEWCWERYKPMNETNEPSGLKKRDIPPEILARRDRRSAELVARFEAEGLYIFADMARAVSPITRNLPVWTTDEPAT